MTVPVDDDVEARLPDAVNRLQLAVDRLVEPLREYGGGVFADAVFLETPSLWEQLVDAVPARSRRDGGRMAARSMPTIWCEAADLVALMNPRTTAWCREGVDTLSGCVPSHSWPQWPPFVNS